METKRYIYEQDKQRAIRETAALLQKGEVVAFPTETVYGLGADATNKVAVNKIFMAKGRPSDNPLIVHVATKSQLKKLVQSYPEYVDKLIDVFSPGPITYVLKSNHSVAENVTGGLDTVGIRIPNHQTALELLTGCGLPIAAPSANISGKPSPTTAQHVIDDLNGKIPAVLDGGSAKVGVESTVIDCTSEVPVILRLGQVTESDLAAVVGRVEVSDSKKTDIPKSPGVKYKHYVPEVPLILVHDSHVVTYIQSEKAKGHRVGILTDVERRLKQEIDYTFLLGKTKQEMASNLYSKLRAMKKADIDVVIVYGLSEDNAGVAVMDRLKRAATTITG